MPFEPARKLARTFRHRLCSTMLLGLLAIAVAATAQPPRDASVRGGKRVVDLVDGRSRADIYAASYALVIGIADYASGWPDLPTARAEVAEIGRILERHGFDVRSEMDLSHGELDRTLREFIAERGQTPAARVLIYFAGHGHSLEQSFGGEMGYLVPADAPQPARDPAGFVRYALSMDQVEVYAKMIQAKHALFVLASRLATPNLVRPQEIVADTIHNKVDRPVRQFLISGGSKSFARRFVEALQGRGDRNGDGTLTGSELGEYLNRPALTILHPRLDKGDFVFPLPAGLIAEIPPPPEPATAATYPPETPRSSPSSPPATSRPGAEWTEPVLELSMRYVPAGEFRMGSPKAEQGRASRRFEKRKRKRLSHGFWMAETEITQAHWRHLMENNPAKHQRCGASCPVESVSWWEAARFANRLSEKSGLEPCYVLNCQGAPGQRTSRKNEYTCDSVRFRGTDCQGYRLPTGVEWERAARADTHTATYAGDLTVRADCDVPELDSIAWYCGNSRRMPHPVGQKKANAWGLHDMLGNVSEWIDFPMSRRMKNFKQWTLLIWPVAMALESYDPSPGTRGGSYREGARACRAAAQSRNYSARNHYDSLGFRVVRTAVPSAR